MYWLTKTVLPAITIIIILCPTNLDSQNSSGSNSSGRLGLSFSL